jgi:hypothetical protein
MSISFPTTFEGLKITSTGHSHTFNKAILARRNLQMVWELMDYQIVSLFNRF